jgi:hypothetical protein
MTKLLCAAVILALGAATSADVRLVVTSSADGYGLTNPSNAFLPSYSNVYTDGTNLDAYDYSHGHYVVNNYPPQASPSGTLANPIDVDVSAGAWSYIWFQFRSEPKGAKVNGLKVLIREAGSSTPALTPTYYVQNDMFGDPPRKRWDGLATAPFYPEWHNNPQTFVAITAHGLVNGDELPQMMFHTYGGTNPRSGVALLGAVTGPADLNKVYELSIQQIAYFAPPAPPADEPTYFRFIPEPASALLLALAGLAMRRR